MNTYRKTRRCAHAVLGLLAPTILIAGCGESVQERPIAAESPTSEARPGSVNVGISPSSAPVSLSSAPVAPMTSTTQPPPPGYDSLKRPRLDG